MVNYNQTKFLEAASRRCNIMGEVFSEIHPECLAVEQWQNENSDLVAGVTTRKGGLSEPPFNTLNMGFHVNDELDTVLKNRERFAEIISFPLNQWVGSEQVHGSTIQKVTKEDMGLGARTIQDAISAADGLYTKERGILLTSLYADCVPLLFFARNHGIIGVAHAGWKGTVQLIGPKMTEKWNNDEGVPLNDIQVAIAPCISKEAYEVDDFVINKVLNALPYAEGKAVYTKKANGKYQLDLRLLNKHLLIEAGIEERNIYVSSICTAEDDRLYSYRAESGETGRFMSYIGLR